MALDGADRARLRGIENELVAADPAFAARLRRGWEPGPAEWSVAAPWVLFVFVVAFLTWVVAPGVGTAAVVVGGAVGFGRWLRRPNLRGRVPR